MNLSPKKSLIIVESYGKVKLIQEIVGNKYTVLACGGHIQDLNPKTISIDINENKKIFEPRYIYLKGKKQFIAKIKNNTYDNILIATDADREGAFIAYSLQKLLGIHESCSNRISFTEITKEAIMEALRNPQRIDKQLVRSQQTRRMIDRIIGYKIQPSLPRGFSVGRVQSSVVKLVFDSCELHRSDIKKIFVKRYLFDYNLIYESEIPEEKMTKSYLHSEIMNSSNVYTIFDIETKNETVYPSRPLSTSALQKECFYKLNISSEKTMDIAQSLYEKGFITYMRTSSTELSQSFLNSMRDKILVEYSKDYLGNIFFNKSKSLKSTNSQQEAHEAIRPSKLHKQLDNLTIMEKKVYHIIFKRTMMACMSSAIYSTKLYKIKNNKSNEMFVRNRSLVFDGFQKMEFGDKIKSSSEQQCKTLSSGDTLYLQKISVREEYISKNTLFNEAGLLSEMEKHMIGRPSTYAYIISHIQKKGYVQKENVDGLTFNCTQRSITLKYEKDSKTIPPEGIYSDISERIKKFEEKNKFIITDKGKQIIVFLQENFGRFIEINYTTEIEEDLDLIVTEKKDHNMILWESYKYITSKDSPKLQKNGDGTLNKEIVSSKSLGLDVDGNRLFSGKSEYGYYIRKEYLRNKNCSQFFSSIKKIDTLKEAREMTIGSYYIGKFRKQNAFVSVKNDKYYISWNKQLKQVPAHTTKITESVLGVIFKQN